jgi:hypothetical protein
MRQTARDASSGASATQVAGAAKIFGDNDKGDNMRAYQTGEQGRGAKKGKRSLAQFINR